ncbi:hypothetical protein Tco_1418267 [Tanacetum coccineum]
MLHTVVSPWWGVTKVVGGFSCDDSLRGDCGLSIGVGKLTSTSLEELQWFNFFLHMGLTDILATFEGLDMGLRGDVIGEDEMSYDDKDEGAG